MRGIIPGRGAQAQEALCMDDGRRPPSAAALPGTGRLAGGVAGVQAEIASSLAGDRKIRRASHLSVVRDVMAGAEAAASEHPGGALREGGAAPHATITRGLAVRTAGEEWDEGLDVLGKNHS